MRYLYVCVIMMLCVTPATAKSYQTMHMGGPRYWAQPPAATLDCLRLANEYDHLRQVALEELESIYYLRLTTMFNPTVNIAMMDTDYKTRILRGNIHDIPALFAEMARRDLTAEFRMIIWELDARHRKFCGTNAP